MTILTYSRGHVRSLPPHLHQGGEGKTTGVYGGHLCAPIHSDLAIRDDLTHQPSTHALDATVIAGAYQPSTRTPAPNQTDRAVLKPDRDRELQAVSPPLWNHKPQHTSSVQKRNRARTENAAQHNHSIHPSIHPPRHPFAESWTTYLDLPPSQGMSESRWLPLGDTR